MGTLLKELRYSLYVTVHPFKGYWEIKHERKGSLRTAGILLTLYILVSVLSGYCTSYLFNPAGGVNFSIYKSVATTLGLFFLWRRGAVYRYFKGDGLRLGAGDSDSVYPHSVELYACADGGFFLYNAGEYRLCLDGVPAVYGNTGYPPIHVCQIGSDDCFHSIGHVYDGLYRPAVFQPNPADVRFFCYALGGA